MDTAKRQGSPISVGNVPGRRQNGDKRGELNSAGLSYEQHLGSAAAWTTITSQQSARSPVTGDERLTAQAQHGIAPRHGEVERAAKRRRIAVACKSCRYRKSRCDGSRPKCSTCIDLGFDCEYSAPAEAATRNRGLTETLSSRLGAVEDAISILNSRVNQHDIQFQVATGRHNHDLPAGLLAAAQHATATSSPHESTIPPHDTTDGMGAVSFSEEENTGFFGPSSNISFTRQIVRAVKATLKNQSPSDQQGANTTPDELPLQSHMLHVSRPPSPLHQRLDSDQYRYENPVYLGLPPEEECMSLIRQYFGRTAVLFPYIHEETFLTTYHEFRSTNTQKVRRSWLGLLNMILAMATRTAVNSKMSAQEREEQSDIFFIRAWRLCEKQIKYSPSLETVQFLLLVGQYLQGTARGVETWSVHGLAVKAAYQLGLQSSDALKRYPPLEREIRTRTWYMCVVLDRNLSMTFGRPFTIPASYIRLPLPQNYALDPSLPLGAGSVSSSLSSLNFFNATIKLYNSIWTIIDSLYGENLGCGSCTGVLDITARLLHIEQELIEWRRTVPMDMVTVSIAELKREQTEPTLPLRFRVILTLRFHNIRIMAHRPILGKFLDVIGASKEDTQEISMLTQYGMDSLQICVQSATTILNIVGYLVKAGEAKRTLLGAWWYTLYYTFNSALVIFSALLIKHIATTPSASIPYPPSSEISKAQLRQAVDTLLLLDNENRMVEKCAKYTGNLYNILETLEASAAEGNDVQTPVPNYADTILNDIPGRQDFSYLLGGGVGPGIDMTEFLVSTDLDFLGQMMGGKSYF